jgi:hypothetical protein
MQRFSYFRFFEIVAKSAGHWRRAPTGSDGRPLNPPKAMLQRSRQKGDRGLSMLEFEKAVELALSQRLDTL